MTKRTKHTHRGECQICCGKHAVDNRTGLLADHGYKVPEHWHQRTGSCAGAGALPYEKGRDVIPRFVQALKDWAAQQRADAKAARALKLFDEVHSGHASWKIERVRTSDAGTKYLWKRYSRPSAWEVNKKPELLKTETPEEHCPSWGEEAHAITERQFNARCVELADSMEYKARKLDADAARWQERFDSWKLKSLTPVGK